MSDAGHLVHASYHKWMLQDDVRTEALLAMIKELVKPGDVVADIGTGTGVLAMLARRAGASKVYAIDASPIVNLAAQAASDSGLDGIEFLHSPAEWVELAGQVDVVFSECLGNFAFGDSMFQALGRFAERWLKPKGRRGPTEVRMFLQPADSRLFWDPHRFWNQPWNGLDLSAFVQAEEDKMCVVDALTSFMLGEAKQVGRFDPYHRADGYLLQGEWHIPEGKWVTGVVGWFDVDWAPGVTMSTSPSAPGTHWSQAMFPVPRRQVGAGERLRFHVEVAFDGEEHPTYIWSGGWVGPDGVERDTFRLGKDRLFKRAVPPPETA